MTLDLSLPALVNSAGAAAFLVVGLVLAVSRGGGARRVLLAIACATFGVAFVANNLVVPDSVTGLALGWVGFALTALAATALAWDLARDATPRGRALLAALGLLGFALVVGSLFADKTQVGLAYHASPSLARAAGVLFGVASSTNVGFALVVAAAGLARPRSRAHATIAIGLGAFGMFNGPHQAIFPMVPAIDAASLLVVEYLALAPWLAPGADAREGRRVAWTLAGLGLVGATFGAVVLANGGTPAIDYGVYGVLRTVCATLLAVWIFQEKAFGIAPPAFLQRRGALAAGALALLFIVAQVAQNFFSATYGLLLGGVLAGAFLFAAAPLQRVAEAMLSRSPRRQAPVAEGPNAGHDAYRRAVRLALRGGALGPQDEVELAHVAHELGLTAPEAVALRHEVEAEKSSKP